MSYQNMSILTDVTKCIGCEKCVDSRFLRNHRGGVPMLRLRCGVALHKLFVLSLVEETVNEHFSVEIWLTDLWKNRFAVPCPLLQSPFLTRSKRITE